MGLAERGFDLEVVLVKARGPHLESVGAKVPVVDLGRSATRYSLVPLARHLRVRRPDVLVAALEHANIVALWARRLARVPTRVVITHHSNVADLGSDASRSQRFWRALRTRFYPSADAIVAVSRGTATNLARSLGIPAECIEVIYNPVIPDDLSELSEPHRPDHAWFHPNQPPVVIGVGRLTELKDFPTFIRAFAILRERRPARLMILGEGSERSALTSLVDELNLADHVEMPGFSANPYGFLAHASSHCRRFMRAFRRS